MIEIWKPIDEYEGYYEVSNTGKVRSIDRTVILDGKRSGQIRKYCGRELKQLFSEDHVFVKLYKGGSYFNASVAHLVANAFLDGFKESGVRYIRYKDGDPKNCSVDNLTFKGDDSDEKSSNKEGCS